MIFLVKNNKYSWIKQKEKEAQLFIAQHLGMRLKKDVSGLDKLTLPQLKKVIAEYHKEIKKAIVLSKKDLESFGKSVWEADKLVKARKATLN